MASPWEFDGQVALVTGAAEGIGWAVAQGLAESGASVILNGRSEDGRLDSRANELRERFSAEVHVIVADARDAKAVSDCYSQVFSLYKRLDVMVANAGILGDARIGMISEDLIADTIQTN